MSKKFIGLCLVFLVCVGIAVQAEGESLNVVSEKLIGQIDRSSWIPESLTVSPDSNRVAYVAKVGNKQCVVVDGKEEKQYDGIAGSTLIFSSDSKRVAYVAMAGDKWFVVIDGKEGKQYDSIVGGVIFDSSESIHYLAIKGSNIYLVKENCKYTPSPNVESVPDPLRIIPDFWSPDSMKSIPDPLRISEGWGHDSMGSVPDSPKSIPDPIRLSPK